MQKTITANDGLHIHVPFLPSLSNLKSSRNSSRLRFAGGKLQKVS